jgi:hypothetical protein
MLLSVALSKLTQKTLESAVLLRALQSVVAVDHAASQS